MLCFVQYIKITWLTTICYYACMVIKYKRYSDELKRDYG